jgi:protein-tyrosine phosphatase
VNQKGRRVLFVCTGNICRSPIAEVIACSKSDVHSFQSAGTATWHVGQPMDPRAATVLAQRNLDPSTHVAQHATHALLGDQDLIVALDRKHREILSRQVDPATTTIVLLRSYDPLGGGATDVADPYYGTHEDFEQCAEHVERSVTGLLEALESGAL